MLYFQLIAKKLTLQTRITYNLIKTKYLNISPNKNCSLINEGAHCKEISFSLFYLRGITLNNIIMHSWKLVSVSSTVLSHVNVSLAHLIVLQVMHWGVHQTVHSVDHRVAQEAGYLVSCRFGTNHLKNIKGIQFERWVHSHGCRKWFNMARDTSNDEIKAVYKMGEKPPIK